MNMSQREPLTTALEPFATVTAPEEQQVIENIYKMPYVDGTDVPHSNADNRSAKLRQLTIYMPPSLNERVRKQVASERRVLRVVMDRVIEEFLDSTPNEPRPYIPEDFTTGLEAVQFRISPDLKERLYSRARLEGRTVSTVFLRAILDYLDRHEFKEAVE